MRTIPYTEGALDLLQQGVIALAKVESTGVRVDTAYITSAVEDTKAKIERKTKKLSESKVMQRWRRRFGTRTNFNSNEQLGKILFDDLKHKCPSLTETGKYKTDEDTLAMLDDPFVHDWVFIKKLHKAVDKLREIERETCDGICHASYGLNTVKTFRSCVAKGTIIEVVRDVAKHPKGIPIEDVKEGDLVYCYDKNRKLVLREVMWSGKTGHRKVVRVHWGACGKHGHLDVTPEHQIRLASGVYKRADELIGMDHRPNWRSLHAPKVQVMAMGRVKDRIFPTDSVEQLDHRFVFESIYGPLKDGDAVHHIDHNHYNNYPLNLQAMNKSAHATHHDVFTDDMRRMGVRQRMENHKIYGDRWASGEACGQWLKISKFGLLRILAKRKGCAARTDIDYSTVVSKAKLWGVNITAVKTRYDGCGVYIGVGRLKRLLKNGRTHTMKKLRVNFYKLKVNMMHRGIPITRRWGNQAGPFVPHNHKILKVEELPNKVDVYDLEVEQCHNFIANEICVHNSCESPNLQNTPVRIEWMKKLVRKCIVARKGRRLIELDYKGVEVKGAYCYHKDPVMKKYLLDATTDLHRDMAMECFMLPQAEITKATRHCSKNQFVFPQFYGAWWMDCAAGMWNMIDTTKLVTTSGTPLKDHLKAHGIKRLGDQNRDNPRPVRGTFEEHIQKIEKHFWDKRFKVYAQWKREWYAQYLKTGWFRTLSGFICQGFMSRNDVINYPVQGFSFHWLLWALTRLVNVEIRKARMKGRVVGQIHDSIIADVPDEETTDFIALARDVMTTQLRKHWKSIIIPVEIEVEVTPVGGNWTEKEEYKLL